MLLATKLFVPALPAARVPRLRLRTRLGAALATRLTLVSAPPGFGKSTLVADWLTDLADMDTAYGWLSLDEQDNDPVRFYTHLLAALHGADPTIGGDFPVLLRTPELPRGETLMSAIINDAAVRDKPLILVLDDYHAVENPDLHKAVTFLIDNMPACMHLVISSRSNPPFPLARWRVRGTLLELREKELRFSHDEIAAFLQQAVDLNMSCADITAIEERTEGWIGALQLAALSMQGANDLHSFLVHFTGSHTYIVDYLVEEVLSRQPDTVQNFLLQTSVLDRMCGDLCAAVTGSLDSEAILHSLHQQNLFIIPLDVERRWFRYHHLFADMLRVRLERQQPRSKQELNLAASRWCEERDLLPEAIHYALAAPDLDRATRLIGNNYWGLLERGAFLQLRSWTRSLPQAAISTHPYLNLVGAWLCLPSYNIQVMENYLNAAEVCLARIAAEDAECNLGCDPSIVPRLPLEITALRSLAALVKGETETACRLAAATIAVIGDEWPLLYCVSAIVLGRGRYFMGDALESVQWCRAAYERALAAHLPFVAGEALNTWLLSLQRTAALDEAVALAHDVIKLAAGDDRYVDLTTPAHYWLAIIFWERNDLAAAEQHAHLALELARRRDMEDMMIRSLAQRTLIEIAQGRYDQALATVSTIYGLSIMTTPFISEWIATLEPRIRLAQGEIAQAARAIERCRVSAQDEVVPAREIELFVHAGLLYAQGSYDQALDLVDRLQKTFAAVQRPRRVVEAQYLRALIRWRQGEPSAAGREIGQALTAAQKFGFVRLFLNMPSCLDEVLTYALGAGCIAPDAEAFGRRILHLYSAQYRPYAGTTIPDAWAGEPRARAGETYPLVEALSERELEVLQLVAQGLSDRQVAERLIVVPGTVKRHLNNIYGKLGVHSRTQALARARAANLLP